MLFTTKAATHEDATRFAPPLLRRALATAKSFTIDNTKIFNSSNLTISKVTLKLQRRFLLILLGQVNHLVQVKIFLIFYQFLFVRSPVTLLLSALFVFRKSKTLKLCNYSDQNIHFPQAFVSLAEN